MSISTTKTRNYVGQPSLHIRAEQPADIAAIEQVTQAAFAPLTYSSHTEQVIVAALRTRGQLAVSLVAMEQGTLVGHVAASPITISSEATDWYGLGPLAVAPARQGLGIGVQLVRAALAALREQQAVGCVVLGEPAYYARFGFRADSALVLPGVPAAYFQALAFTGQLPVGTVP